MQRRMLAIGNQLSSGDSDKFVLQSQPIYNIWSNSIQDQQNQRVNDKFKNLKYGAK